MRRVILIGLLMMLTACSDATVDESGILVAHSSYSMRANGDRTSLNVMERPKLLCLSVDLALAATDAPAQWREHALAPERHARLVSLVDDLALVDRYRIDARPPGSVRECIQDTSICYEPGIVLTPGPLSTLGYAAYALYIPPETDVAWTEETAQMVEEYGAALDECISEGTPVPIPAALRHLVQAPELEHNGS